MLGEILTIVAALCWALGASLYKKSLLNVRPVTLNLFRSFPATIYAFLVLYLLGKWTLLTELNMVSLAYIGIASLLVLAVGDILYFSGLKSVGVGQGRSNCLLLFNFRRRDQHYLSRRVADCSDLAWDCSGCLRDLAGGWSS